MHLPEPWNGHLSKAKIMLISSNPSISKDEDFPTNEWYDDKIIDFFDNRFLNERYVGARYYRDLAKYISWILPQASELLPNQIFDKYIVTTEIVHCKSRSEDGVNACQFKEAGYMNSILSKFKGDIIIIVGSKARDMYENKIFSINCRCRIAFIAAPNAHGYTDEERKKILLEQLK